MRRGSKRYFALLRQLVISELKLKDQSTFFGFFWSFLNPLLMLTVMFVLFSRRFGQEMENYGVYLLVGIIFYTHFSNATARAMRSVSGMRRLTANAVFPKEILVMASVLGDLIEFGVALGVGLIIAVVAGADLGWNILMLPGVIVLQCVVTLWVSLLLSCVHVFVPDIMHIYQVFLRVLLFITPIFYGRRFIGDDGLAATIVQLNPLTHLIGFARSLVIGSDPFSPLVFGGWLAVNALLVVVALGIFKRYEPRFAETV